MINLNAWFQKHGLCAENILYIYRKDRKTVIQRTDGAEFALFVPVHSVLSTLPEKNFLSISKGIVVCRSHIVNISNDGVYTMSDGRTFQGRKRDMSSHRRLRAEIELTNTKHRPLSMLEKCSLLDNMPLAFCVIELVFNEDGCGVDFIFRYCNAEMATVEGVPVEEMLNRSFYRVFPNGDKKWLGFFAKTDVDVERYREFKPFSDTVIVIDYVLGNEDNDVVCECIEEVWDAFFIGVHNAELTQQTANLMDKYNQIADKIAENGYIATWCTENYARLMLLWLRRNDYRSAANCWKQMMKFQQRFADDEDILKAIAGAADGRFYSLYIYDVSGR